MPRQSPTVPTFFAWAFRLETYLVAAATCLTLFVAYTGVQSIWEFTTDDAYITLRYSKHLVAGHGIVWNPQDPVPVEGYSNYFFVLLGAVAIWAGTDPVLTLKLAGVVGLLATLIALWCCARTFVDRVSAFAPGLMLLAYPGEVHWTASGLETAVYQAFVLGSIALCFWALGFRPPTQWPGWQSPPPTTIHRRALAASAVFLLLASLTRPEGPVVAVVLAVVLYRRVRFDSKTWLPLLGIYVLPMVIYHAWRWMHFETIVGHSVVCKAAYEGDPMVLLRSYWKLVYPVGLLALFRPWKTFDARHLVLIGIPLIYGGLLYGMDPVIGHENRHALTAYAILMVVACTNLTILARSFTSGFRPQFWSIFITVFIGWFAYNNISKISPRYKKNAHNYAKRMSARESLGKWLDERTEASDHIVIGDSGIVPYLIEAQVIDVYCLNCLAMTRPDINFDTDKFLDWILDQKPRFIAVHSYSTKKLKPYRYYGVFPPMTAHSRFKADYVHRKTFGVGKFAYWVFELENR